MREERNRGEERGVVLLLSQGDIIIKIKQKKKGNASYQKKEAGEVPNPTVQNFGPMGKISVRWYQDAYKSSLLRFNNRKNC